MKLIIYPLASPLLAANANALEERIPIHETNAISQLRRDQRTAA
jgi:hypothetical protein